MRNLLWLFIFFVSPSFAQSWDWARQGTGSGAGQVYMIATDTSHHAIVTGKFNGVLTFGSHTLSGGEMFLVKYDSIGNSIWARSASGYCTGYAVATDKYNNIFAAGYVYGSVTFGPYTLSSPFTSSYNAKYDGNGNILWAKQSVSASGICGAIARGVSSDMNGNSYLAGYFNDTVSFDAYPLYCTTGSYSFLVKYDSNGNVVWARQPSGTGWASAFGSATDRFGNTFITGVFGGTLSFGSCTINGAGTQNSFLVKYDSTGNVIWARQSNTNDQVNAYAVAIDKQGNPCITGDFEGNTSFGTYTVTSANNVKDIFITKYDSAGNVKWAEQGIINDANQWTGFSVAADNNYNFYVTSGNGNVVINNSSITIGSVTLSENNVVDAMVLFKLDSAGQALCGTINHTGGVFCNSIAVDTVTNDFYFGSSVYSNSVFGPDAVSLTNAKLPLIAKWQNCEIITNVNEDHSQNTTAIDLYPNPSDGNFFIANADRKKLGIRIYDLSQQLVYQEEISGSGNEIDLHFLSEGIYFAYINAENETTIRKLVIQK